MADLAKIIVEFLVAFFGLKEGESSPLYLLAVKALKAFPNLRPATEKEDARISSPHTATAHNADATRYIPVRDKRDVSIPIVLKPIESKGNVLCYIPVLDTDKVGSMAVCEAFAKLYMSKTLASKKTFDALASSLFARQSGEDLVNNARQREGRKIAEHSALVSLAKPFLSLSDEIWQSVRPSVEQTNDALAEIIDEMREQK